MRGLRRVPAAILLACGAALAVGGAARAAITDPTDITGLQLWLDAQDVDGDGAADSITDGAAINAWVDRSGNGNNATQGTAANQPVYVASDPLLGGSPVVRFDSQAKWMALASAVGGSSGAGSTVFIIFRQTTPQGIWANPLHATANWMHMIEPGNMRDFERGGGGFGIPAVVSAATWAVQTCQIKTADYALWIDGVSQGASADTNDLDGFEYLNDDTGGNSAIMDVAAVIIYDRVLTELERSWIEEYLRNKWLPVGLVAHYELDETSAGPAVNSVNPGTDDGVNTGAVIDQPGKVGSGAYEFDGTAAFVAADPADWTASAYTVALWAKAASAVQPQYSSVFNNNSAANDFQIDLNGGTPRSYRWRGGSNHLFGEVTTEWVHLAATWDGATLRLYYDGGETASTALAAGSAGENFSVYELGRNRNATEFFAGLIDDVRVYDRALWPEEVADLAGGLGAGLAAHWKLDESSGATQADDATGNGNHGTPVVGATSGSAGRIDGAWDFDGNDYVVVPDTVINPDQGTIAGWVNLHSLTSDWQDLFGTASSPCRYYLQVSTAGVATARIRDPSFGTRTLNPGQWYHLAVTWVRNGPGILYVDGIEAGSTPDVGGTSAPQESCIGAFERQTDNDNLNGLADDVRVYSRALSADEIYRLAGGTDSGLVAHWRLDEDTGTTAYDSTGNHFDGTLTGGPTWTSTAQIGANALDFDGTGNHYVETGKTASELGIGGNDARTVTLWCHTRAFNGGGLFSIGPTSNDNQFCLRALDPSVKDGTDNWWRIQYWAGDYDFNTDTGAGFTGGASSGIVSLDNWVHFAHVHDGTNTYIYINGDLKVTWATTIDTTDDVTFRLGYYNGTNYYNGILDDVRLYNRALSGPEVRELLDRGNVQVSPDSGLVTAEDAGSASHTATFTVVLGSAPTADVTVDVSSSDTGEGVIEGATAGVLTLVFTPSDWDTPQTVSVTGVDDDLHDLHVPYTADMALSSADPVFDGGVRSAGITNRDDEFGTNLVAWYRLDGEEGPPSITSAAPTQALNGYEYVYQITTYGRPAPVTLDVVIPSPADTWLTFDTVDTIRGTPSSNGTTGDITVTLENALGSVQQVFQITVSDFVGDGLYAEWWDDTNGDMTAPAGITEVVATVSFTSFAYGDPTGRFTGLVKADETGTYTFQLDHDDGVILWVNGVQLIDSGFPSGTGTRNGTIDLVAGDTYPIELHYADTGGGNRIHLRWAHPSASSTFVVIPQTNLCSLSAGTGPAAGPPVYGTPADLIAEDSAGENDGTLTDMTGFEWRNGQIAGALEFDGTDDHVSVLDSAGISVTGDLTVAAWVNATSWPNSANIIAKDSNASYRFRIQGNGGALWLRLVDDVGNESEQVSYSFSTGTWYHVVATADLGTGEVIFYVNGSQVGTTQTTARTSIVDSTGPLRIGTYNGSSENFDGLIDDVRIYDCALSGPEVQALYEGGLTTVMPTYGLVTSEDPAAANHTATFMVWLNSAPADDVTISLSSSDTGEGTIDGAASNVLVLTFTPSGPGAWNVPQTVTVTGFDEDIDDGDATYTIDLSSTSSADASFDGLEVADVWLTNLDDDTAGVTVTPTTAIVTTEAGPGTATFTVVLTSEPAAPVTVDVESSDTAEGTVSPAQLVFSDLTWNSVRTVTVTGVDDFIDDIVNNMSYSISFTVSSADGMYDGLPVSDIPATNTDDDTAGITLSPPSGLATTEAGAGTDTFTVVLDSEPTAPVTVSVSSSDTTEGTVSPGVFVFTGANWSSGFIVTVTGVNDDLGDGDADYYVDLDPIVSADPDYQGRVESIPVTNEDDEPVVYINTAVTDPTAQEHATTPGDAAFTVVRESRRGSPVTVDVPVSFTVGGTAVRGLSDDYVLYADATPIADATTGFTIPAGGASSSVIIYVKPQDDDLGEGPESVVFSLVARPDGRYYAVEGPSTDAATILDDEPVVTVVTSVPAASEPSASGEFTVTRTTVFRADEAFDIHFTLAGSATAGTDYVTIPPSPVTILANEGSATVTVVPFDDRREEGDETVTFAIVGNGAFGYTVGAPGAASVTIADDERPGIGGGTGCAPGPAPVGAAGAAWGLVCLAAAALVRRRAKAGPRP